MARSIFLAVAIALFAIVWPAKDIAAQSQTITVYPQRGRIGEAFSVTGRGFPSFASLTVQFAGKGRSTTSDYGGNFQTSFLVSATTEPGMYGVEVLSGGDSSAAFAVFEVLPPNLIIYSQFVMAGDRITVWIHGGVPFTPVRIFLDRGEIITIPQNPMVGLNGNAELQVIIPNIAPGYHDLKIFRGTKFEASREVFLIPDPPGKIERVLSPISIKVVRVWGYYGGVWVLYDPLIPPELNTLREFTEGSGYFLLVKESYELAAVGGRFYKLYKGWNLIGW